MKTIHDGKRYDSDKCERLAERDHHNNGNYSGTTHIVRASDGELLIYRWTNGQDCYLSDEFYVPDEPINFAGYDMTDEQAARCAELGLIKIVA